MPLPGGDQISVTFVGPGPTLWGSYFDPETQSSRLAGWYFEGGDLTPNPLPAKAMMRALGHPAGQCH